jgi:hypothetical protein
MEFRARTTAKILAIGLLFLSGNGVAWARAWAPLFGPEWTFFSGSEKFDPNRWLRLAQEKICAGGHCEAKLSDDGRSVLVKYKDKWWFEITDDYNVIEIKAKPATEARFRELKDRIHTDVFEFFKGEGYEPHESVGGGHISIGRSSAFGGRDLLLRNWIVDIFNHSELGSGVFRDRSRFAMTFADFSPHTRLRVADKIAAYDRGELRDIEELLLDIHSIMGISLPSTKHDLGLRLFHSVIPEPRYQRVEQRWIVPQKDVDTFLLQIRLFQARLEHLKTLKKPIELKLTPRRMTAKQKVLNFRDYVTESKLDWNDYKFLITEELAAQARELIQAICSGLGGR